MAQDMREVAGVLRAERFELVGRDGRTRAVLGRLNDQPGEGIYGLDILDRTGTRLEVSTGPDGPSLSLVQGGNQRVVVNVMEGPEAVMPGPGFFLCEADGRAVVRFEVEDEIPDT